APGPAGAEQPRPAGAEHSPPAGAEQPSFGGPWASPADTPPAYAPAYDPTSTAPTDPYGNAYGYPPGYPAYGYGVAAPPTNGMAIASMIVSIVGLVGICAYGIGGYIGAVGAILGHVSRRQVRERGESGDGMALAGIIIGWIATGIALAATAGLVALVVLAARDPT
ncbi:MAG TPA: DUF4190 domain-containing protein, partial [Micromonosporaceae bacterium]|nr:DUF4190 domain-containing protein [Micromonosporaceae bacterium]